MARQSTRKAQKNILEAAYKATSFKAKPSKEKHVRALVLRTFDTQSGSNEEIIRALQNRMEKQNWAVVLKSLMIFHRCFRDGDQSFVETLKGKSHQVFALRTFVSLAPANHVYTQFVKKYSQYLEEKVSVWRLFNQQFEKVTHETFVKDLAIPSCFKLVPKLQSQMNALLNCKMKQQYVGSNELIHRTYMLLLKDSVVLYPLLHKCILCLLDLFWKMEKSHARKTLNIYTLYVKETDALISLYDLAKTFVRSLPEVQKAETSIVQSMEQYVNSIPGDEVDPDKADAKASTDNDSTSENSEDSDNSKKPNKYDSNNHRGRLNVDKSFENYTGGDVQHQSPEKDDETESSGDEDDDDNDDDFLNNLFANLKLPELKPIITPQSLSLLDAVAQRPTAVLQQQMQIQQLQQQQLQVQQQQLQVQQQQLQVQQPQQNFYENQILQQKLLLEEQEKSLARQEKQTQQQLQQLQFQQKQQQLELLKQQQLQQQQLQQQLREQEQKLQIERQQQQQKILQQQQLQQLQQRLQQMQQQMQSGLIQVQQLQIQLQNPTVPLQQKLQIQHKLSEMQPQYQHAQQIQSQLQQQILQLQSQLGIPPTQLAVSSTPSVIIAPSSPSPAPAPSISSALTSTPSSVPSSPFSTGSNPFATTSNPFLKNSNPPASPCATTPTFPPASPSPFSVPSGSISSTSGGSVTGSSSGIPPPNSGIPPSSLPLHSVTGSSSGMPPSSGIPPGSSGIPPPGSSGLPPLSGASATSTTITSSSFVSSGDPFGGTNPFL